jgi:hypothetical protein
MNGASQLIRQFDPAPGQVPALRVFRSRRDVDIRSTSLNAAVARC